MPYINVKTNQQIAEDTAESIKAQLGQAIAAIPGKSEGWLMVGIEDDAKLWFKGGDAPAAMVTVSLYGGASSSSLSNLTGRITDILNSDLNIPSDRIYVAYFPTDDWGWNGSNF